MDASIDIFYERQLYSISKLPTSFTKLKNQLISICKLTGNFTIQLSNTYGSKYLITCNKSYQRFFLTSQCTSLMITKHSPETLSEEVPVLQRSSKLLKRPQKSPEPPKIDQIPDEELCTICYNRFQSPMASKCNHVFCLGCWEKSLKNLLECPLCRTRVRLTQLIPVNPKTS